MKTMLITLGLFTMLFCSTAKAQDTYIDGYVRNDGTYVQPHHRSAPDSYMDNNFSTRGNINPYTRDRGTVNPPSIGGGRGENDFRPMEYRNGRPSSYGRIR